MASACAAPGLAWAGVDDPLTLILSRTLTRDSNVFRTSGVAAPAVDDTTTSTAVTLKLDTQIGRQKLQLSLAQSRNTYKKLGALDNSSSNHLLSWQGTFPERIAADGTWARTESIASFADLRNSTVRDIVTTDSARLRLAYSPHMDWPVHVQFANNKSTHSVASLAGNDLESATTELGLQYVTQLGNQAGVVARSTHGSYPKRAPVSAAIAGNVYRQQEMLAVVQWKPGIKSTLNLQLGQTRRETDGLPQSAFKGNTGNLNFDWAVTDKAGINATIGRQVTAQSFTQAQYSVVRSEGLGLTWVPTAKVSLAVRIGRQSSISAGNTTASGTTLMPADTTRSSSLVLQYSPWTEVQLTMQLRRENRESNDPARSFASNIAVLGAGLSF